MVLSTRSLFANTKTTNRLRVQYVAISLFCHTQVCVWYVVVVKIVQLRGSIAQKQIVVLKSKLIKDAKVERDKTINTHTHNERSNDSPHPACSPKEGLHSSELW